MPRLQINYENAVVYKLCCKDVNITNIYVGSTTNFRQRKAQHKSACNKETGNKYNINIYVFIRTNGGWENWEMVEIEKVACVDSNELQTRERFYLETLKADLNRCIPTRHIEEYYVDHRIEIMERSNRYYNEHKPIIMAKKKIYRENNREAINQQQSEKKTCECGRSYTQNHYKRHLETQFHLAFELAKENVVI